jgi:hypothetical protein
MWSFASIVIGAGLVFSWWRKKDNSVRVHQHGILYSRYGSMYALRWQDISHIWQRSVRRSVNFIPVGTFHEYKIRTSDGTFVLKGDLSSIKDLGDELLRRTFEVQLGPGIEAFDRGEMLSFGPLGLSRSGIAFGSKQLSWSEVRDIRFRDGDVLIVGQGKYMSWATVAIAEVPNITLFNALSSEILKRVASAYSTLQPTSAITDYYYLTLLAWAEAAELGT